MSYNYIIARNSIIDWLNGAWISMMNDDDSINGDFRAWANQYFLYDSVIDTIYGIYVGNYNSSVSIYDNELKIKNGNSGYVDGFSGFSLGNQSRVSVYNNTIEISGGSTLDSLYGAYGSGDENGVVYVSGNTITVTEGSTVHNDIVGATGRSQGGKVSVYQNIVRIWNNSTVSGTVYGGRGYGGDAAIYENSVGIGSGSSANNAFGGFMQSYGTSTMGEVYQNTVSVGGKITGTAYGGVNEAAGDVHDNSIHSTGEANVIGGGLSTGNGNVTANKATINGGKVVSATGGRSDGSGTVSQNTVAINDGEVTSASGGMGTSSGTVENNSLTIDNGLVEAAFGGVSCGSGTVRDNSVMISGGTVVQVAGGASTAAAAVIQNSTTINGGTVTKAFGGTNTAASTVKDNTVTINDGTVETAAGGMGTGSGQVISNSLNHANGVVTNAFGGYGAGSAIVQNNTASIAGGTAKYAAGGGGEAAATIDGNTLLANAGIVENAYGGLSNGSGPVQNNIAKIDGSTVTNAFGGYGTAGGTVDGNSLLLDSGSVASAAGGFGTGTGAVTNNIVDVNADIATAAIYGGYAASNATVADNSVVLNRNTASGVSVFGAYSEGASAITDNAVILPHDNLSVGRLYGAGHTGQAVVSGNALEIYGKAITAVSVSHFNNFYFLLPADIVPTSDTVLTLTDSTPADISSSRVGVAIEAGGSPLNDGDRVTLIHSDAGLVANNIAKTPTTAMLSKLKGARFIGTQGISLDYNFFLETDANNLYAVVGPDPVDPDTPGVSVNPQTKTLAEGRAAGLAFCNEGADLVAGRGMDAARNALLHEGPGWKVAPFAASQASHYRLESGSHVWQSGFSLLAGMGLGTVDIWGHLMFAPFLESGWGNYSSHNDFADKPSVTGTGKSRYHGGGVLGLYETPTFAWGHGWLEASYRTGYSEVTFRSDDLRDAQSHRASYTSGVRYQGWHAGLGWQWQPTDMDSLELYAKYLHTDMDGDEVTVVGDPVAFEASHSSRLQAGARYWHTASVHGMTVRPYVGAAYEREFQGTIRATTYGRDIPAPSLKGDTLMVETGLSVLPTKDANLSFDLNVKGFTGQRQGVQLGFQLSYAF